VGTLMTIVNMIRQDVLNHSNWAFAGKFDDFENPLIVHFFLTQLLFGNKNLNLEGLRSQEVDKSVDVACQFLTQNTRSDRQVKHVPKKKGCFRRTIQTPLSVGLPLVLQSRVRDKILVNNLSTVYIGNEYKKLIDIENRLQPGMLQQMRDTGDSAWMKEISNSNSFPWKISYVVHTNQQALLPSQVCDGSSSEQRTKKRKCCHQLELH